MGSYPIIQKDEPVGLVELAANAQTTLMNPYFRYLLSQSSGSRGTVKSTLRQLCMLLFKHDRPAEANWGKVDSVTVDLLVEALRKKRYSPKTCHRYMSVLRGILNKAREVGLLDVNEYHNIKSIRGRFGSKQTKGRSLSELEVQQVFESLRRDTSIFGIRDLAIVGIYLGCGLRRAELIDINMGDINFREQFFIVNGKGRKDRIVPLPPGLDVLIKNWIEFYRGEEPGALFCSIQNSTEELRRDELGGLKRLSVRAINYMITNRLAILSVPATTHDLRRSFAERRLAQDGDMKTLQDLLGHTNLNTTAIYLRSPKRIFNSAENDTLFS